MSKPRFGKILDPELMPTRDAVHVPIIPAVAANELYIADKLVLQKDAAGVVKAYRWNPESGRPFTAIADPFFREKILEDQLFYAWLRPESTQKLWHEWTHYELDK